MLTRSGTDVLNFFRRNLRRRNLVKMAIINAGICVNYDEDALLDWPPAAMTEKAAARSSY